MNAYTVTKITPTGEFRPSTFPCVICHEMIEGPGAEYMRIEVCGIESRMPVRRHFLNDTHSVTSRTIDYKPVPFRKAF